jgi:hypothetical protein
VQLQSVRWQRAASGEGKGAQAVDLAELALKPGETTVAGLRARVKLLNRGPGVEGVLLRYALSGKIAPEDGSVQPILAVPFAIDEKRVPKVGANEFHEVAVDPTAFVNLYLKRLARDGYRLHELRLQIMVSPRRGDKSAQTVETALPVVVR